MEWLPILFCTVLMPVFAFLIIMAFQRGRIEIDFMREILEKYAQEIHKFGTANVSANAFGYKITGEVNGYKYHLGYLPRKKLSFSYKKALLGANLSVVVINLKDGDYNKHERRMEVLDKEVDPFGGQIAISGKKVMWTRPKRNPEDRIVTFLNNLISQFIKIENS